MGWEGTAEKDKKSEVEKFLPRAVGKVALGPCVCVWSERAGHSTCSSRLEAGVGVAGGGERMKGRRGWLVSGAGRRSEGKEKILVYLDLSVEFRLRRMA